ncbi:putative histidine kinase [Candidatus Magnetomoraceae bacterium gMMP-13]
MTHNKIKEHDEKILIVEDNPEVCEMWKKILKKKGYQNITTAFDGENALEKWQSSSYDLMIVDLRMPRMNGEELIKEVRKVDENIGIIVLTGHGDLSEAYKLLDKYQISDFLTKPLKHPSELLFSVRNVLEKSLLKKQLKKYNLQLEARVKERTVELLKTNEELLSAKEAAECASQAKSDFLLSLSHELNTPLNAIIGLSELLDFKKQNEDESEYIRTIINNAWHLHSLISEILEFSRMDHNDVYLSLSECDLISFLKKCLKLVDKQAMNKKIQITLIISSENGKSTIVVDENKLKKVMFHLLLNAIMFSSEGEIISIEAQNKKDEIIIKVCDTGIGIEPENQQKVFIPFFQVHSGLSNKSPGIGLGLTIAKRIVENHHGKIWVESKGKNKGSEFCFSLPQKK